MTSYNQIGSMHRPPVSSFTDPYEDETPVGFGRSTPHPDYTGSMSPTNGPGQTGTVPAKTNHHVRGSSNGNGAGGGAPYTSSLNRPNHTRQTSFTGSLGRNTQPGTLTGSLNRRDHWTNEYRNEGHSHTLQHYYG